MSRRLRSMVVPVLVVAVVVAACGGGDQGSEGTTGAVGGEAPVQLEGQVNDHGVGDVSNRTIDIEVDDFYFQPTFVRGDQGTTVQVKLSNEGSTAHTFTVEGQDADVVLQPGDSQTVEVNIAGDSVTFFCRFHRRQGMQGAFFTGSS